jgi:hypothetical protein
VLIDDPVVVRALQTWTRSSISPRAWAIPVIGKKANEFLRILRTKRHADLSATFKSWAIRHSWSPKSAAGWEALVKNIRSLKIKAILASFHDPNGRYLRWKADI